MASLALWHEAQAAASVESEKEKKKEEMAGREGKEGIYRARGGWRLCRRPGWRPRLGGKLMDGPWAHSVWLEELSLDAAAMA